MRCSRLDLGGGEVAIICGPRPRRSRCSACGQLSETLLCDWKLHGVKAGKTCDAKVCRSCGREVGPDKHLCPPHARAWDRHPKNPNRKDG